MPIPIPANVKLKTKRSRAGLGLFAVEPIKRSSYVIEYVGTVVRGHAVDELANKYLFEPFPHDRRQCTLEYRAVH